ncbi:MAG: ATP-binding protein [Dorea sp.]|nr:ATP-binding protein [Dorea sp.]
MIIEYTCENHKSIKEKVTFSMLASKDNSFEDLLIPFNGILVNKAASIYGANGSGKTSFMESLYFFKTLVCNSNNHQPGDKIRQFPHKLSAPETPTTYTLQFVKGDIRYAYGLSYTREQVLSEYLYYFPHGKQAKIFDRAFSEITFGDKFKKDFETILNFSKPNKLFLSVSANYSAVKEAETVFLFFKEDLIFYPIAQEVNNWLEYSIERLTNEPDIKPLFIKFMNSIECPIQNIRTRFEKTNMTPELLPLDMPRPLKELLSHANIQEAQIIASELDYGIFSVDLDDESKGIQKLFEVFCPIIEIIQNNKILIWDEIETSLHPRIVNEILRLILHGKQNSRAQLIFSTHDTNLLDLTRFRRDQIWFTELSPSRSTDLFSLAELKNVRKDENISKGYLNGKYGAIPFIHNPLIFPTEEV